MKTLRYTGILIGLSVAVAGILALLERYAGFHGSGSASGIVAVMGAAMFEGQFFAKAEGRVPEKIEKRRFARMATLVNLLVTVLVMVPLSMAMPEMSDATVLPILAGLMLFIFVVIYFASGHFYGLGAKNALKVAEKKRAKAGG